MELTMGVLWGRKSGSCTTLAEPGEQGGASENFGKFD